MRRIYSWLLVCALTCSTFVVTAQTDDVTDAQEQDQMPSEEQMRQELQQKMDQHMNEMKKQSDQQAPTATTEKLELAPAKPESEAETKTTTTSTTAAHPATVETTATSPAEPAVSTTTKAQPESTPAAAVSATEKPESAPATSTTTTVKPESESASSTATTEHPKSESQATTTTASQPVAPTAASPSTEPAAITAPAPTQSVAPKPVTATGPAAPTDADREACVAKINSYRATIGLPDLQRWKEAETCADQSSQSDATSKKMHSSMGSCGEFAQDTCPGYNSYGQINETCFKMMWEEGPPPEPCTGRCVIDHIHYINMSNKNYTKVACGFFTQPDGKIYSNQIFK